MPVGTVRGRFELDAPALKTLRELERQGIRTQKQMESLGKEMDRVGGADDDQRIRNYSKSVADLRRTSERAHRDMRADWVETTRVVRIETGRQSRAVEGLQRRLDRLGSTTAAPSIDLDGVTAAIGQVEVLQRKLDSLSRQRATPSVSTRSFAAAGLPGGPGPRAPRLGGGGGRRRGGRAVDFGMRGVRPRNLLIGGALAEGRNLIGGAGALALSAGSGLGGAGALGITGLGAGVIGGGLGVAVGKTVSKPIQETYKAQALYTQAVALHGRASTQAASAQDKLNLALSRAPEGTRMFLRELDQLRTTWRSATRDAQANLIQGGAGFLGGIRGGIRGRGGFAGSANIATGAIGAQATNFGQFLGGTQGRRGVRVGANIFAENLPKIEKDLEHIFVIWTNIMRASRPFFRQMNTDLEKTLANWEKGTSNIRETRRNIRQMVDDLKTWGRLLRSTTTLLVDLGKAGGAREGSNLVQDLTNWIDKMDRQVNRNPAQVRAFFKDTVQGTKDLARALGELVKALNDILKAIGPVLSNLANLVSLAGQLGILGNPGALAAGFGLYRGLRGGGGAAKGGGLLGGIGAGEAGGVGAIWGARSAARAGAPGLAGQRIYGEDFRYGAPTSQLGRRGPIGALQRFGGKVPGALGGAAKGYLPIAALFAAAEASSFQGSGQQKLQAGFSSFSLGAVPMPKSDPESKDRGVRIANQFLGAPDLRSRTSFREQQSHLAQRILGAERLRATDPLSSPPGSRPGAARGPQGGFVAPPGAGTGSSEKTFEFQGRKFNQREFNAYIGTLRKELGVRRGINAELQKEAHLALQQQRRQRADKTFKDLAKAYDILRKRFGAKDALASFNERIVKEMQKAGPAGRLQLARNGAAWVREMRKNGQLSAEEAKKANENIIDTFRRLHQRIRIVNGRILTGTKTEWKGIQEAITGAAEEARQKANDEFTRLQKVAIASLESMGISHKAAQQIVHMQDVDSSARDRTAGRFAAANARDPLSAGAHGQQRKVRARGGRIPGYGLRDTVPVGPGAVAAPGELIVNRHTERRVNRFLGGQTTLGREVAHEGRAHSAELRDTPHMRGAYGLHRRRRPGTDVYAVGGRSPDRALNLMGANPNLMGYAQEGSRFGLTVSSGLRRGAITSSGNTSLHASGHAIDVSGSAPNMLRFTRFMSRTYGPGLEELIHTPAGRAQIKNGRSYVFTGQVAADHFDHVHVGDVDPHGRVRGGARLAGGPAAGGGSIRLRPRRSGLGGVPGALADRAGQIYAAGLQRSVNRQLGGGNLDGFTGGGGANANRRLARRMMLAAGWPGSEWASLNPLWTGESNFDEKIRNRSSGATGIPQALPGSKMASAGADWRTNPATQIKWGLGYIRGRYGSPSAAYQAWLSRNPHWYARGGRVGGTAYVGDSLGVGTAPFMSGVRANVKVGRSSASGVRALQGMSGYGRLIFDLGTNDPSAGALTRSLRQADQLSGGAPIYVPTVHGPGAAAKNRALAAMAGGDIHLLRMGSQGLGPDGIHYTGAGYRARAARFAGAFRAGGSFMTDGPTSFVAGDGPRRREHVQVTPTRPRRRPAGVHLGIARGAAGVSVDVHFHGAVHVRSDADIAKIADKVGEKLAGYLENDVGADEELIGG